MNIDHEPAKEGAVLNRRRPEKDRPVEQRRAGYNDELGKRSQPVYITEVPECLPEAALFYAQLGWPIVPLHNVSGGFCSCGRQVVNNRGSLVHTSAGKHPLTLHGSKDATTDLTQINRWWEQWPNANIGIRMDGMSVGLDVDPRNGGNTTLEDLEAQFGQLPPTPTVDTGGGGQHFHFQHAGEPIRSTKGLGPGLDLIGERTLLVLPPSRHLTGEYYRWRQDCPNDPAPLPDWIMQIIKSDATTKSKSRGRGIRSPQGKNKARTEEPAPLDGDLDLATLLKGVPEGQRDETIFKYACSLRSRGVSKGEAEALITVAHGGLEDGTHPFTLKDALKKVDEVWKRYKGPDALPKNRKKVSVASELIELANQRCDLFHDREECFVSIDVEQHRETYELRSPSFRQWLQAEFWRKHEKAPHSQAIQDALSTLEAMALFDGQQVSVFLRVAEHNGAIYVDSGNKDWHIFKITPTGWTVLKRSSVRFRRPKNSEALQSPTRGGDLNSLREFVNVEEEDFVLVLAYLVAALRPGRPCPILALNGEQGSAKTTLSRIIRRLIDPNSIPTKRPPRNTEELMVAARHSYLLVFDNMSGVRNSLSDDFASIVTGTGLSVRRLYTNFDEASFKAQSPIVINGIEELGSRGDFLDRLIPITLPTISDTQRETEDAFNARFTEMAPRIIGALFDAVATGLGRIDRIELTSHGRMADFYEWAVAAGPGLGYTAEEILGALERSRKRTTAAALEASALVQPLRELLLDRKGKFLGNASSILSALEGYVPDTGAPKDWPRNPKALGDQLRRLTPDLRRVGIEVHWVANGRKWRITLVDPYGER